MEQTIISDGVKMDVSRLFEEKQKAIGNFAKEVAEREFELMEFNLFVSASGKKHLDMASEGVAKLRKMESQGKINLSSYEDLADEF